MFHAKVFDDVMTFDYLKVKIWLSQERKKLSEWNESNVLCLTSALFYTYTKQTSKNVADKTFDGLKY